MIPALLALVACWAPEPAPAPEQLACGYDAPFENCVQACDRGEQNACAEIAQRYSLGEGGVEADPDQADAFYERACTGGNAMACYSLAVQAGLEGDGARMGKLLTQACDKGFGQACDALAYEIEAGSVPGEVGALVPLQRKACDDGVAIACHWLGDMAVLGRGLPQDALAAAEYYRKACHDIAPGQCGGMGLRLTSRPVIASPEEIVQAAAEGCAAGEGSACVRLAVYTEAGYGIAADPPAALAALAQVCTPTPQPGCKPMADSYRAPESLLLPGRSSVPDPDPK